MPQKATSHVNQKTKQKDGLPVSIHPDDAKDKVFTAILKALIKMGNKPSSPKELANIIVKHKYATLGGATPFATVSSRISQHFKRAAEHNPPRAPLLAKHIDQNHSRKINYSLATDSVPNEGSATETHDDNNTAANTAEASDNGEGSSSANSSRKVIKKRTSKKLRSRTIIEEEEQEDGDNEQEEEQEDYVSKKAKHKGRYFTSIHPSQQEPKQSSIGGYSPPSQLANETDKNTSDEDHSDYHEEMLKGDSAELDASINPGRRSSRRLSTLNKSATTDAKNPTKTTVNTTAIAKSNDTDITNSTITHSSPPSPPTTQESVLPSTSSTTTPSPTTTTADTNNTTTTTSKLVATPPPQSLANQDSNNSNRKPSFSFSSGFPGDQELWTPFSFEHDFDNVFLQDASTAHHIPFHIATPESVSVSELDDYFSSTSNSSTRAQRKSFSSAMLGPNDKSLLQKVLLASAARGVADKIDEEDEANADKKKEEIDTTSIKLETADSSTNASEANTSVDVASLPPSTTATTTAVATDTTRLSNTDSTMQKKPETTQPISSSSLMDVDNGEDFVKFEDDEKKEVSAQTSGLSTPSSSAPINTTTTTPAPVKKMADILPATPTTLSAAEILKSMNIQNLNLSALHQMTSNIPSLQHLSPTFDLAKTMAAYMQSLAKSANANASSSNSPHAMDLKSILARFPALEAFIKKDPSSVTPPSLSPITSNATTAAVTNNNTSASSSSSATTTDFIPNLISGANSPSTTSSFTAGSTEPIVHTLTTMNPPMYITLIDHIAVCIVVLPKTETTPEYRIMRRVDTGFINGTVLLTAGGIETESERSMILSFEMERVRMPKKKSQLFGTWIPLRRAQELAVTCSIQHKLGHFLDDSIEAYFPSPLPIQVNARKPARDSRLTALALAALRSETKNNGFIVPPISRQSSSSGSMAAAQLQELLLTHPHKALKSNGMLGNKAPLLGRYDEKHEPIIPSKTSHHHRHHHHQKRNSSSVSASSVNSSSVNSDKEESDVDIVNSSDSPAASSNEEESDDELDDKLRKPTTSSSSTQQTTINLEEILNRVTPKQPMHIHPRDLQKKRRRSSIGEKDKEEPVPKSIKSSHSRKKSGNGSNSGGKWSSNNKASASVAVKKSNSGSGTTITIKRPAASTAAHSSATATSHGKKSNSKKEEEEIDNVVVEHTATKSNSLQPSTTMAKSTATGSANSANNNNHGDKANEENASSSSLSISATATKATAISANEDDEDDEDIDIGGSDFDDDLR